MQKRAGYSIDGLFAPRRKDFRLDENQRPSLHKKCSRIYF
jgi:hypothetical protein